MSDITLDDNLDNLSAEELEKLIDQDDGEATIQPDNQNFTIEGIDELNNPAEVPAEVPAGEVPAAAEAPAGEVPAPAEAPAGEVPAPAEAPAGEVPAAAEAPAGEVPAAAEAPAGEVPAAEDYQAKYNEVMAILAQQKLLEQQVPAKPETPADTRSIYDKTVATVELSPEEQAKYDAYKEYDEDQAEIYQSQIKQKRILEDMLEYQQKSEAEKRQHAETSKAEEEATWNEVISKNDNMKTWQQNPGEWEQVNNTFKIVSSSKGFNDLSKDDQIKLVEQRHLLVTGRAAPEPVNPADDVYKKIADVENTVKPPSSLSSVAGGNSDQKPGEVLIDESMSGVEIQEIMNKLAESDDPNAIDNWLSSTNYAR